MFCSNLGPIGPVGAPGARGQAGPTGPQGDPAPGGMTSEENDDFVNDGKVT